MKAIISACFTLLLLPLLPAPQAQGEEGNLLEGEIVYFVKSHRGDFLKELSLNGDSAAGGDNNAYLNLLSPYGIPLEDIPDPEEQAEMFTGYRRTSLTGLDDARARGYSSVIGRFLQADPALDPLNLNRYAYCAGNPIILRDYTGKGTCTIYGPKDLAAHTANLIVNVFAKYDPRISALVTPVEKGGIDYNVQISLQPEVREGDLVWEGLTTTSNPAYLCIEDVTYQLSLSNSATIQLRESLPEYDFVFDLYHELNNALTYMTDGWPHYPGDYLNDENTYRVFIETHQVYQSIDFFNKTLKDNCGLLPEGFGKYLEDKKNYNWSANFENYFPEEKGIYCDTVTPILSNGVIYN